MTDDLGKIYNEDGYCVACGNGKWKSHMPECEIARLERVALRLYQYGNALMGDLRSPDVFGTQTPSIDATITGWMRVRGEYERLTSTSQDNNSNEGNEDAN